MTSFLIGFGVLKESVIKETFVFCGRKFFRLRDDFVSVGFGVLKESVIKEMFGFFLCGRKFFRLRDDFVSDWF